MAFFGLIKDKPVQLVTQTVQVQDSFNSDVKTFTINYNSSITFQPLFRTANGFLFGENGLFPQELNYLYAKSPLHSAIIDFKKLLAVGNGFEYSLENLSASEKISFHQLLMQFEDIVESVALDYFNHSRICLEVTWSEDFSRIVKVERIAPEKIRISQVNNKMEPISFLYNWDWTDSTRFNTREIPVFDNTNRSSRTQLFWYQVESMGQKLYSEPSFISAYPWVYLDSEMSEYHKANITNSLNPSILIQYFQKPETEKQKAEILRDLVASFGGARKTGRAMVTFADGKEFSPEVKQMEANKLDKTFLSLTDTIQRQICYAHRMNPVLLGLKTAGSLGNTNEFDYSYKLFDVSVIQPAQRSLERIFNRFLSINQIPTKLKLQDASLVDVKQNVYSPNN